MSTGSRELKRLVCIVVILLSACGNGRTNVATQAQTPREIGYEQRIAILRTEGVLEIAWPGSVVVGSGETTSCVDPEFDKRVPAVFKRYRTPAGQVTPSDLLDWMRPKIEGQAWKSLGLLPYGESGRAESYTKAFADWTSLLSITSSEDTYQITLQASDKSSC